MKNCKSCKKEIDADASKCPYCQAFQKWWKSPQALGLIFPLTFIPFIFTTTGLWNQKSYTDYKDSFSLESVSSSSDASNNIYTYRITNNTDLKWKRISYQLVGYNASGEIAQVKSKQEYSWLIMPNSSSMISVKTNKNSPVAKWEFKIVDLNTGRY